MNLTLVTGPAVEPVSLAEAKQHCRIEDDDTTDDALVMALVASARLHLDGYSGILGRCLVNQTWRLDLPCFSDWVDIPLPPLQSVDSVKYYDTGDVLQTVATTVYETILGGTSGGYVHLLGDQSWPTDIDTDRAMPVQIAFTAGYGASWNDVPQPIRTAILYQVARMYEARGDDVVGQTVVEDKTFGRLVAPYRAVGFG